MYTTEIPSTPLPFSDAEPKRRLLRCSLSWATLATVDTNAPGMSIGSGQIKILRSGLYYLAGSWDFNSGLGTTAQLEIRVDGAQVCTSYYQNYYTNSARFILTAQRKMRLEKDQIVTLYANLWAGNGSVTWLDAFEENDVKIL